MKLLRIKFELICLILLIVNTARFLYFYEYIKCKETTEMLIIDIIVLVLYCCAYNSIKNYRREIIRRC